MPEFPQLWLDMLAGSPGDDAHAEPLHDVAS
jgi:3-phosphoshikimate 1-carboxyvinyltransferase